MKPPDRGYGYVAASRFRSKAGVYLFGKVRRTDWLPVRDTEQAMERDQLDRSEESMDEYDSEEEDAEVRPLDYCHSEHSDDAGDHCVDYDDACACNAEHSYEDLESEYNFSFPTMREPGRVYEHPILPL